MAGHTGGETSKLSCDLNKINRQLKSGKTLRGIDLDKIPNKREELEEEKRSKLSGGKKRGDLPGVPSKDSAFGGSTSGAGSKNTGGAENNADNFDEVAAGKDAESDGAAPAGADAA